METKTIIQKRWWSILLLFAFGILQVNAQNIPNLDTQWEEVEVYDNSSGGFLGFVVEITVSGECDACGEKYSEGGEAIYAPAVGLDDVKETEDDLIDKVAENFCQDCGYCSESGNSSCYNHHHCRDCGDCIDEPYCHACYEVSHEYFLCSSCGENHNVNHCEYCNEHLDADVDRCDCDVAIPHCVNCADQKCKYCDVCLIIDGNETSFAAGACMEHEICRDCLEEGFDEDHCKDCYSCASEICDECGLCEDCTLGNNHCPLCDQCFGYGVSVAWCESGGDHCVDCCDDNEWICIQCGQCTEATGLEYCEDCGLCEECCVSNSEEEGCTHGYCIFSTEYLDHICPSCQQCTDDTECEYCGYCEECQADYHCQHELCPDGPDWEDHLCLDCGECCEPDELCEYCGKCENCAEYYHCEHGYCPDGDLDDGDHFICDQCGECFEGFDRCDYCELCETCCEANTEMESCEHQLCLESPDFADHWCYEDDQCLEKCNHNPDCSHPNVNSEWNSDGTAHWHVCNDCGAAVNKAIHTEGEPVTVTEPDPVNRKNGTASVSCNVCNSSMGTVSIPYIPIPEDGSPYIITQPKDYEGKTSTSASIVGGERHATFTVRAGGKNLTYQWYEKLGKTNADVIADDGFFYEGTNTAQLKVYVLSDACANQEYQKYYCVVTNASGSVQTNTVYVRAEHSFGHYQNNGDGTHSYRCNGECDEVKFTKPHRIGEWVLIRPATESETGLMEQTCMDCGAKNQKIIPKVEPGHQHEYDQPRYTATEHWFACRCGIVSTAPHAPHTWGTPNIITAPTEKRPGKQEVTCTACGFMKTETLDKLPHEHVWWNVYDDPAKGGHNSRRHYSYCQSGDGALNDKPHVWSEWECTRVPVDTIKGRIFRECLECFQGEWSYFPSGTYPVMVIGGTADKNYAVPGETVTITYDVNYGKEVNSSIDYKLKRWVDGVTYDGSTMPYGDSWIDIPRITFANPTSAVTTFVMPNGPGVVGVDLEECQHTGGTHQGERLEPTCTGYGHDPDAICNDCGKVMTEGARIDPLGHDLALDQPASGTVVNKYCTYQKSKYGNVYETTHPTGYGYGGDLYCWRCKKWTKGNKTPIIHKLVYTSSGLDDHSTTVIYDERTKLSGTNYVAPTCTKDGVDRDTLCSYCDKVLGKGKKIPRLGHNWGEWTTIREATKKVQGREQRVCLNDDSHVETRNTGYSGPDYTLKADKVRLNFEWVYGETPEPQTVTFRSVGRTEITAIKSIKPGKGLAQVSVAIDGMQLTITPIVDNVLVNPSPRTISLNEVMWGTWTVNASVVNAPDIIVTFTIKKKAHELHYASATKAVNVGETGFGPILYGRLKNMPMEYQSSDNSVATVNRTTGRVTARAPGAATITAIYAGDDYNASARASYTLIVRDQRGDVNRDGKVDIADVTALVNITKGMDNEEPFVLNHPAADVNRDGSVTTADARVLVNTMLNNYPFMYVEDVFTLTDRGTVATGTILSGLIQTGQSIVLRYITDNVPDVPLTVNGIELFRVSVPEATAGESVGILMNIDKDNISHGDVLTTVDNPNVVRSKTVKGTFYLYTKEEGGRHTPISKNYSPDMLVGGVNFSSKCTDLGTIDGAVPSLVMPGQTSENVVFVVQDEEKTPYTYKGQVIYLREGGKTIGKLTITGY